MALPFLSSSLRTLLGSSNSLKGLMPLGVLVSFFITFPIQIADGETRTPDLLITNQLLYHLSYIGKNHYSILSGGRASSTFTFSFRFTPRGSYIGKNHYSILSGGRASSTFTFSFRFTPRGSYIGKNHYSILSGGRASSTFTFSFRFTPRGSYIGILYQYNTNKLYSNLKNFYVIKYYKFLLTLTKKIFISIILYTETKV